MTLFQSLIDRRDFLKTGTKLLALAATAGLTGSCAGKTETPDPKTTWYGCGPYGSGTYQNK